MKVTNTILSIVRHVLTAAGVYLVTTGKLSESTSHEIVGGLLALIGVIWGAGDEAVAENTGTSSK